MDNGYAQCQWLSLIALHHARQVPERVSAHTTHKGAARARAWERTDGLREDREASDESPATAPEAGQEERPARGDRAADAVWRATRSDKTWPRVTDRAPTEASTNERRAVSEEHFDFNAQGKTARERERDTIFDRRILRSSVNGADKIGRFDVKKKRKQEEKDGKASNSNSKKKDGNCKRRRRTKRRRGKKKGGRSRRMRRRRRRRRSRTTKISARESKARRRHRQQTTTSVTKRRHKGSVQLQETKAQPEQQAK